MRLVKHEEPRELVLFRSRLDQIISMRHEAGPSSAPFRSPQTPDA